MKNDAGRITFGRELRRLEVGGFVLTETFHAPRLTLPRHDHECANLNLTLDGSFRETVGNRPQECEPGSLLIKPAGESHGNKYGGRGAHCLIVELLPHQLDDVRRLTNLFEAPAHVQGGSLPLLARRVYDEFRRRAGGFELVVEGLILEMLGQASRQTGPDEASPLPVWLRRAEELIRQHFTEKLSLRTIARAVDVHPSHLARTFRKRHHCSVGEYVRRLRVEYAARALLQPDAALADISLAAGFSDQSHFTHEFKRQMRLTPSQYKNLHARN